MKKEKYKRKLVNLSTQTLSKANANILQAEKFANLKQTTLTLTLSLVVQASYMILKLRRLLNMSMMILLRYSKLVGTQIDKTEKMLCKRKFDVLKLETHETLLMHLKMRTS